jgi:hypothetical protein
MVLYTLYAFFVYMYDSTGCYLSEEIIFLNYFCPYLPKNIHLESLRAVYSSVIYWPINYIALFTPLRLSTVTVLFFELEVNVKFFLRIL